MPTSSAGWAESTAALEASNRQLRESEQRRSLALAAGQMGSWDLDVTTGECQLDAGQYRILGIDPENAQLDLDRAFVHPDDLARIEGLKRQGATTDTNSFQTDIRIPRPDGKRDGVSAPRR